MSPNNKNIKASPPHCLIVTHLSLLDLEEKGFGVYKRLSMLMGAAVQTGLPIHVFCVASEEDIQNYGEAALNDLAAQSINEHWGYSCDVVVGRRVPSSNKPWILRQLMGVLSYSLDPLKSVILDQNSISALSELLARNPNFVIAHRLPLMDALVKLDVPWPRVFFDLDDIEHVASIRSTEYQESMRALLFSILSVPALVVSEYRAISRATTAFVCSQQDQRRIAKWFPSQKIEVIPNALTIPNIEQDKVSLDSVPKAPVLMIVGVYSYLPNKDAVEYFVREIFPLIRSDCADAQLWVVGGGSDHLAIEHDPSEGIHIKGFVKDLGVLYRDARVVVCPVRQGSGTRVKLIEAAAWGKPIVTTAIGAEGLGFKPDIHALYGDSAEGFADECLRLLFNDELCLNLSSEARIFASEHFDKSRVMENLTQLFIGAKD